MELIFSSAVEYTSLEDAVAVAEYVLEKGLAGVMTWDVNRDCRYVSIDTGRQQGQSLVTQYLDKNKTPFD